MEGGNVSAKIFKFSRDIEFSTEICDRCEKECDSESCLALEMLRQLCLQRNPGVQVETLMNVANLFSYEGGDAQ